MNREREFIRKSREIVADLEHRNKIRNNISKYDQAVPKGKLQFYDLDLARRRAAVLRHRVLENLEKYLTEFESAFRANGGKVIWASTKKEAVQEIYKLLKKSKASSVLKSKSIMTEELELNEFLESKDIEPVETDLGEYIVQLAGEKPYHILTPAMHKSKEDVAHLFHEKFGTSKDSTPEEITAFVREKLRKRFVTGEVGITGANFLLADVGAVCLTENEGNAFMSVSFPKIHIAIAGVEKIIPSMDDLHMLWPLLSTYGTGQKVTVYNSILSGPKKNGETDGPEEMYVILLDNRRSEILKQTRQRRALSCIRCGACLNACPIYRNIGGYTYNATYSGPIGSVISPFLNDFGEYKHLSYASSLCGKCTEVCPVKIPIHELLLVNRRDAVRNRYSRNSERLIMLALREVLKHRSIMNAGGRLKNKMLSRTFGKKWGPERDIPELQSRSFNQIWKEKNKKKKNSGN